MSAGQIKVFNGEGVEVNIQTPDSLISNEAQQKGVFSVDVQDGATKAFAETGAVYMNNGTTTVPLKAAQDDDNDTDGNSSLAPLIIFVGAVAAAIVYVAVKDGNDDGAFISPRR